jgi:hypothetical protein
MAPTPIPVPIKVSAKNKLPKASKISHVHIDDHRPEAISQFGLRKQIAQGMFHIGNQRRRMARNTDSKFTRAQDQIDDDSYQCDTIGSKKYWAMGMVSNVWRRHPANS